MVYHLSILTSVKLDVRHHAVAIEACSVYEAIGLAHQVAEKIRPNAEQCSVMLNRAFIEGFVVTKDNVNLVIESEP